MSISVLSFGSFGISLVEGSWEERDGGGLGVGGFHFPLSAPIKKFSLRQFLSSKKIYIFRKYNFVHLLPCKKCSILSMM